MDPQGGVGGCNTPYWSAATSASRRSSETGFSMPDSWWGLVTVREQVRGWVPAFDGQRRRRGGRGEEQRREKREEKRDRGSRLGETAGG